MDLQELYQDVILDHSRQPRNFRRIEGARHYAEGHNPVCGDHIMVYVNTADGSIDDVAFQGDGCAICMAAASMMTRVVKGQSLDDTRSLFETFHDLLTRDPPPDAAASNIGELAALAGVRRFPIRVKCATLPWHTLKAALDNEREASTE